MYGFKFIENTEGVLKIEEIGFELSKPKTCHLLLKA